MPWTTPGLADLRKLNRDFVTARIGSSALIPNSVARILTDANAGLAHLVLQYADWLAKQMLPDTAEGDWLRHRHAQIWLGGWKKATPASGTATFTGVEGTVIPQGTRLFAGVPGSYVEFTTTAQGTVGALGTVDVAIEALTMGTQGNLEAGAALDLAEAITGLDGAATVVSLSGATDEETDDELRTRVLQRIRKPPMGGCADDYEKWALDVPGVTRAWVAPLEMGIGTVTVRFMMDDLRAADDGFPNAGDIAAVEAYLDAVRPVTVKDLFVEAPVAHAVDFEIADLYPDNTSIRAAIAASVEEMLRDRAAPAYARNGVAQDAQTIYAAWVSEAIYHAEGVERFRLVMTDEAMPSPGHIAVLGTITYS